MQATINSSHRNKLSEMRRKLCDYSFLVALLGIILMIIENELTTINNYREYKTSNCSYILQLLIVFSTAILLALIISYHVIDIKIIMSDNGFNNWRFALTSKRRVLLCVEIFVCAICPFPGECYVTWFKGMEIPIDVPLSIPMFLRFYLFGRFAFQHSTVFADTNIRRIGALRRINFTAEYVLKTILTTSTGTFLFYFTCSYWLIAAWVVRLCERWKTGDSDHIDGKFENYLSSLWYIIMTSLRIGVGDMAPVTYCGRLISIICGITGTVTTTLFVSVITKNLELTRNEKHVHNFLMDTQLTIRLKNAAANVIGQSWLIFKYAKLIDERNQSKILFHQKKYLAAIDEMREVNCRRRMLAADSAAAPDTSKQISEMHEAVYNVNSSQENLQLKVAALTLQCSHIEFQIGELCQTMQNYPDSICQRLLQEINQH